LRSGLRVRTRVSSADKAVRIRREQFRPHRIMRVLHVVESLDRGAVENWLVRMFLRAKTLGHDPDWTFYCMLAQPGRQEDAVERHGGKVLRSPCEFRETTRSLLSLRKAIRSGGFDVLHCHHDFTSGFYLAAAAGLPIRKRYVHVHNTDEALPTPSRLKRRLLLEPLRQSCLQMADGICGISDHTLDQFLRGRPPRPGRDRVIYYGVDTAPIRAAAVDPVRFRGELGLPSDARILLFVGRMAPLKNPCFVLDVLEAVLPRERRAHAVFAGAGDLEAEVRRRAAERGLSGRVRLLGWRDDGPRLMRNSDLFVFPRLEEPKEGLGLVVVEAQACGLPVLTTPGVCDDAVVDPGLVTRLPLADGPARWAGRAVELMDRNRDRAREAAAAAVEASRFGMDASVDRLLEMYAVAAGRRTAAGRAGAGT